ncbi:MAG: RNA polymerase sigma factor [Bacteroidota bacterium]
MRTSEDDLVRDFQRGEDLAYAALYNRYKRHIYCFCLKMVGDEDEVKDIVQEVFLKMYEHRMQLANPSRFRAWLFMIARNQCLTHYRDEKRTTPFDEGWSMLESLETESLIQEIERNEEVFLVRAFINQLKPEYREVIVLREYQGLSYEEIADVIGATIAAVKAKLFKARKELFEKMKPVFIERR